MNVNPEVSKNLLKLNCILKFFGVRLYWEYEYIMGECTKSKLLLKGKNRT